MSDQDVTTAPDEVQDTPEAPEAGQQEVDWAKRYNDLQPEYTRTAQEAAEYRRFIEALQDPDHPQHQEARAQVGLDPVDTPDDDPEFDDPYEELKQEIEALKTERQTEKQRQEEEQAYKQFLTDVNSDIDSLEAELGEQLDDDEAELLIDLAETAAIRGEQVTVKDLYERYNGLVTKRQQRYVETKKVPRPRSGSAASKQPDLDNEAERHRWLEERLRANQE